MPDTLSQMTATRHHPEYVVSATAASTAAMHAVSGSAPAGQESGSGGGSRRAQTAPSFPPLMKGSRHSVLISPSTVPPSSVLDKDLAPSSLRVDGGSGKGGVGKIVGGIVRGGKWQREAWVGEGGEREEEGEQFPFLTEEDGKELLLPDDRFEVCVGCLAASPRTVRWLLK